MTSFITSYQYSNENIICDADWIQAHEELSCFGGRMASWLLSLYVANGLKPEWGVKTVRTGYDPYVVRLESWIMVAIAVHKMTRRTLNVHPKDYTQRDEDNALVFRLLAPRTHPVRWQHNMDIIKYGDLVLFHEKITDFLKILRYVLRLHYLSCWNGLSREVVRQEWYIDTENGFIWYPGVPLTPYDTSPLQRNSIVDRLVYKDIENTHYPSGPIVRIDITLPDAVQFDDGDLCNILVNKETSELYIELETIRYILWEDGVLASAYSRSYYMNWVFHWRSIFFTVDDLCWMSWLFNDRMFMSYRSQPEVQEEAMMIEKEAYQNEWNGFIHSIRQQQQPIVDLQVNNPSLVALVTPV
jgi:hypothetical protein